MVRAVTEDPAPVGGNGEHTGPINLGGVVNLGKKPSKAWLALVGVLLGSGGLVSSFYLTEARSKDNAALIEEHEDLPAHYDADKRIERIEHDVTDVKETVEEIQTQQMAISDGIDQLKEEARTDKQKRLERQLEEARRELRRRRRER